MKNILKITSNTAIMIALMATAAIAGAQKGGNSGGSTETGTPFTIVKAISVNGKVPTWSGTYTLTPGIPGYYTWDTLQVTIKGKPLNLPDNSVLHVTYYFSDSVTGVPYAPFQAGNLVCLKSLGTIKNVSNHINPAYTSMNRHLDQVVVWADDGTVVLIAKG